MSSSATSVHTVPAGHQSSHAHLHPPTSESEPTTVDTVRALFDELNIELVLKGLLGEGRVRLTDVYCPEVRRSTTATRGSTVTHLDVVSCWKGLSFNQAAEVAYWETSFMICLEAMMRDAIIQLFAGYLRGENESLNKSTSFITLSRFLALENPRLIAISVPDLVSDMIEGFYADGAHNKYTWFISSRNLPTMVFNFLLTRDCFLDTLPFPSVAIDFTPNRCDSAMCIVGTVDWHPPCIPFYKLPSTVRVGDEYRIACDYVAPDLSECFTVYPEDPEYSVSSSHLPLAWDANVRCFRTIVPEYRSRSMPQQQHQQQDILEHIEVRNATTCETTFSAKIVTEFPGDIRFERTTRYIIRLQVWPRSPRNAVPASPSQNADPAHVTCPTNNSSLSEEAVSVNTSVRPGGSHPAARLNACGPASAPVPQERSCPSDPRIPVSDSHYESQSDTSEESVCNSSVERGMGAESHPHKAPMASDDACTTRRESEHVTRCRMRGSSLDDALDAIPSHNPRPNFWQKKGEMRGGHTTSETLEKDSSETEGKYVHSERSRELESDSRARLVQACHVIKEYLQNSLGSRPTDCYPIVGAYFSSVGRKRKAAYASPDSAISEEPTALIWEKHTVAQEAGCAPESAAKRQKRERTDSGVYVPPQDIIKRHGTWDDEVANLANFVTAVLGDESMPDGEEAVWGTIRKDIENERQSEWNAKSKGAADLQSQNIRVTHGVSTRLSQEEIQKNWEEFVREKERREQRSMSPKKAHAQDEDEQAMADIFLASDRSGSGSDLEWESSELAEG